MGRLHACLAAFLAFLVALAPTAGAASARIEALRFASDFDPSTEQSVELVAHGGHALALPSSTSVELPVAPLYALPSRATRAWVVGREGTPPRIEPAPEPVLRARVGLTIPRRCPPRLEDDDGP
jgi:hypothetical protein